MEEAYGNLNAAYLQIKGMVVIEGFYALIAGFVITTFVFKLVGIIKEMTNEGKGFNARQNATAINTQNITVRSKTFPHTPWSGNAALCNPYVILPSVLHIA